MLLQSRLVRGLKACFSGNAELSTHDLGASIEICENAVGSSPDFSLGACPKSCGNEARPSRIASLRALTSARSRSGRRRVTTMRRIEFRRIVATSREATDEERRRPGQRLLRRLGAFAVAALFHEVEPAPRQPGATIGGEHLAVDVSGRR